METATNPETGERLQLVDNEWVPIVTATNPTTGERVQQVGGEWIPAPEKMSHAQQVYAKNKARSSNPTVKAEGVGELALEPLSAGFSAAGDYVSGLAQQAVQGLTFGFGDEIKAAAQTGRDWITGGDGDYDTYVAQNRGDIEQFRSENPKASIASEMVGAVGTAGGLPKLLAKQLPRLSAALLPQTARGAAGVGLLEGGVYGAGTGEGFDDSVQNAVIGAATGAVAGPVLHGAGELAGRVARNVPGLEKFKWKPEGAKAQQNLKTAKDLGYELTPAQVTGHRGLEQFEANLQRNMGGSGAFQKGWDNNQALAQRTANKSLGIDGVEVDLGKAKQANSAMFAKATATGDKIALDRQFIKDVATVKRDYSRAWGKVDKSRVFDDIRDEIAKGSINATRYQYLSSRLSKDIHQAATAGDGGLVSLYGGLQRALDKAADRSIPESNKVFRKAREAFRTRKMLEKPGVVNAATGEISIPKMANAMRKDTGGYVHGFNQTPLYNVGRMSHAFKNSIGDSGTPTASPAAIPAALAYYPLSRGYSAIPNALFGSSGGGKIANKATPAASAFILNGLDEYKKPKQR